MPVPARGHPVHAQIQHSAQAIVLCEFLDMNLVYKAVCDLSIETFIASPPRFPSHLFRDSRLGRFNRQTPSPIAGSTSRCRYQHAGPNVDKDCWEQHSQHRESLCHRVWFRLIHVGERSMRARTLEPLRCAVSTAARSWCFPGGQGRQLRFATRDRTFPGDARQIAKCFKLASAPAETKQQVNGVKRGASYGVMMKARRSLYLPLEHCI
jgi:hypothetical protein